MGTLGSFDPDLRSEAWFDPELVIEGWFDPEWIHTGGAPAAPFDPAAGFDWSEQPAAWQGQAWFQPDTEVWTPIPSLTVAPVDARAGLWPEQPGQEAPVVRFWYSPEEAHAPPVILTILPLDSSLTGDLWHDHSYQQARSIAPTWFAPDASVDSFPPLPNAPTHPDLGWDAIFDRDQRVRWFAPGPYVESPLPLASPLTPLATNLLAALWPDASGQQDRSIQPIWFRPDDPQEGLAPPPFDPSIGFDWTDRSGQQDRSIQLVWYAPDAETQLLQTIAPPPTVATVAQQAAMWPEQPAAWQAHANITNAIEPWFMGLNINLYAPAPGATPSVLINAENGDVFLYIGAGFIVPAS